MSDVGVSFLCPNGDILCRVGRHVATRHWSRRRHKKMSCRLERLNDTTFDDMSGNSRHVGNFLIVVWVQTEKLYGRVANSYVWTDLYLSAVIDINWVCRGLFCVGTTRNVGQDLATFGDVGDMSATRRRHVELRQYWFDTSPSLSHAPQLRRTVPSPSRRTSCLWSTALGTAPCWHFWQSQWWSSWCRSEAWQWYPSQLTEPPHLESEWMVAPPPYRESPSRPPPSSTPW